jgi:hypothetical protein
MELIVFYFRKCLLSTNGCNLLFFYGRFKNHTPVSMENNTVVLFKTPLENCFCSPRLTIDYHTFVVLLTALENWV